MDVLKLLTQKLAGTVGVRDGYGFFTGHSATLPACEARRRGEVCSGRRVPEAALNLNASAAMLRRHEVVRAA